MSSSSLSELDKLKIATKIINSYYDAPIVTIVECVICKSIFPARQQKMEHRTCRSEDCKLEARRIRQRKAGWNTLDQNSPEQ